MLNIEELKPEDEFLWQEYIINSKEATLYHTLSWRNVVQQALRHRPYYLVAKEGSLIKGILPLFLVNSIFFGRALVSISAANYGSACADEERIKKMLIEKAKELTHILKADYLELKEFYPNYYDLPCDQSHLTFIVHLDPSVNLIWSELGKNVRSAVRKAIRSGLRIRWNFNEWKDEFYNIYLHTMRRLGSPAYSDQFFKTILKEFPNNSCIVSIEYKGKIIASDLVVFFKKTILPIVSGAYKDFLPLRPNNFISWEEIKHGCENGFEFYDFGRSQWNTGSFEFKRRWGVNPHQLYYYYYLNKSNSLPRRSPPDPKWRLYQKIWKRLPLFFARRLGPKIIRYLH